MVALRANIAFLFLFLAYVVQSFVVRHRLVNAVTGNSPWKSLSDLWIFIAMSLVIPILIGVLPDLFGVSGDTPPVAQMGFLTLYFGVRFMIAYLITIVTLELALQAQAFQQGKDNPWFGLLVTNLGFDIVSILVFQMFKSTLSTGSSAGRSVPVFFVMCALPTVLTGVIVVCGSYSALTTGDSR
jgi:hypothetical protein